MDPIIEIEVLNERKFTSAKDNIGAVGVINWNEHLFFEPKNVVSIIKLDISVLNITLLNYRPKRQ